MHIRLFSQMYIATQVRGGDLDEFFCHETLPYPPALSKGGELRSGNKSDLAKCIQPAEIVSTVPKVNAAVLEGSVIVNMTKPKQNQSFKSYSAESFYPRVKKFQMEYSILNGSTWCLIPIKFPVLKQQQERSGEKEYGERCKTIPLHQQIGMLFSDWIKAKLNYSPIFQKS